MIRRTLALAADEAGVVAPATVAVLAVLIGFVAMVGDVGVWFAERRNLQAVTDAAALASAPAAADAAAARTQAQAFLVANGRAADVLVDVEPGYYCPAAGSPTQRFQASPCDGSSVVTPDAVRVQTRVRAPMILSRAIVGANAADKSILVTATAAEVNAAGLEAGAGVASLDAGLANSVLTSLAGGAISLTAADYQGLASARVDGLALLDALGAQAGVSAGTYRQLLDTEVSVDEVLDAAIDVLGRAPNVADATAAVAGLRRLEGQLPAGQRIKLGGLFDLGLWDSASIGHAADSTAALDAGVNVYQLTSFALQLANGDHAVAIPNATVGVPGLAGVTLAATAVEPPQGAYFAFGPAGAHVHTATVRSKIVLNVPALNGIIGTVSLPLYVEAGGGDAEISGIGCSGDPANDAQVQVAARSGLANIYVGAPDTDLMRNFDHAITDADIAPAQVLKTDFLNLGLVQVDAGLKAHAAIGQGAGDLMFVQPAAAGALGAGVIGQPIGGARTALTPTAARIGSTQLAGSLAGLADSLQMSVRICPVICIVNTKQGLQLGPLFTTLKPVLTGLDGTLTGLLQALGVQAGYLDVAVTGVRCGLPVLIA